MGKRRRTRAVSPFLSSVGFRFWICALRGGSASPGDDPFGIELCRLHPRAEHRKQVGQELLRCGVEINAPCFRSKLDGGGPRSETEFEMTSGGARGLA